MFVSLAVSWLIALLWVLLVWVFWHSGFPVVLSSRMEACFVGWERDLGWGWAKQGDVAIAVSIMRNKSLLESSIPF